MKIIKILLPLVLFVIGGVIGVFSKPFIQIYKPFLYWPILPGFILGVYYAFRLTSKYDKNKGGGVALGRIGITLLITAISFRAIQGYIILFNCYVGRQTEKEIIGQVSEIDFPKPKQIFTKNTITIILSDDEEKITLEVIDENYYIGQVFEKKMTLGSFGLLYSSR